MPLFNLTTCFLFLFLNFRLPLTPILTLFLRTIISLLLLLFPLFLLLPLLLQLLPLLLLKGITLIAFGSSIIEGSLPVITLSELAEHEDDMVEIEDQPASHELSNRQSPCFNIEACSTI